MEIFFRYFFILILLAFKSTYATEVVFPKAEQARPIPLAYTPTTKEADIREKQVKYNLYLGSQRFAELESAFSAISKDYLSKKMSANDFFDNLIAMAPLKAGKIQLDNLIAWTDAYPNSYAAWYCLGRTYFELAKNARGEKWINQTSQEQLAEMDHYAKLATASLEKSLRLFAKPFPSFRALIASNNFTLETSDKGLQKAFLEKSIQLEPDTTAVYSVYFLYNTPRWGGSFEDLYAIVNAAEKNRKLSKDNLNFIRSLLFEYAARDLLDLSKNPREAAKAYLKAYEVMPDSNHRYLLYSAAKAAKTAKDFDLAIEMYSLLIKTNPNDFDALFNRGVLYLEEKGDVESHFKDQIASALLGYMYAQNNIGYYYMTGARGAPKDLYQAKAWLTLAANQGYDHAKEKLPLVEKEIMALRK